MGFEEILERLSRFHEFKDLVVLGMRRGYLERDEALRLVKLLRSIVEDVSGGKAKVTLHLIDALEEVIRNPGSLMKHAVKQEFGREDVVPMPRYLAKLLPELPLLKILRLPLGMSLRILSGTLGVNPRVVEVLMSIRLRDLAYELGYLFEVLLEQAHEYAKLVEEYILTHDVRGVQLDGAKLSAFAEVVARAWLTTVVKGPWKGAEPTIRQVKRYQYEFDAVAIETIEEWVRVHVAEVEVYSHRFLERIEGKIKRLEKLLRDYMDAYKKLGYGVKGVCLAEFVMICFDDPEHSIVMRILEKTRSKLEELRNWLCPDFSSKKNVKIFGGRNLVEKTFHTRLREAIEWIVQYTTRRHT